MTCSIICPIEVNSSPVLSKVTPSLLGPILLGTWQAGFLVLSSCAKASSDVLLWVEEDNVQLGAEENDKADHRREADCDRHGRCPRITCGADVYRDKGQPDDTRCVPARGKGHMTMTCV